MPKPNRKRSKAKRGPIFGNDPAPVRSSSAAIKNHLKPYQTKFVAEVVEVGYGDNQGKARVRRAGDEITIALPEAEPAGSTSLFIKNTIGFHFGQQIVLMRDDGSVTEDALVNSISEQDGTITLKNPTANAFAAGDKVRTISGRGFYDVVGGSVRVGDSCWCLSDTGGIVILAGGSGGGPIGSSCPYHGTSDPPGGEYLIEDKRSLLISEYPELFDVIGTRYGQGNSPGLTFNLPDTRGMTYIGAGNSPNFTNRPLGTMGGSESVALVAADMPIHNHSGSPPVILLLNTALCTPESGHTKFAPYLWTSPVSGLVLFSTSPPVRVLVPRLSPSESITSISTSSAFGSGTMSPCTFALYRSL